MDSGGASNSMSRTDKIPCALTHLGATQSQMSGCLPQLKMITKIYCWMSSMTQAPTTLTIKTGSFAICSHISLILIALDPEGSAIQVLRSHPPSSRSSQLNIEQFAYGSHQLCTTRESLALDIRCLTAGLRPVLESCGHPSTS